MKRLATIAAALALSGCMVGPNSKQPGSPVPDRYAAAYPTTQPLSTQPAVTQAYLRLVHHVQPLQVDRSLQPADDLELRLRAHCTKVALSLLSNSSRMSSRTGFSIGPAMLRPRASPSRNADSRTRRSNPLTISTGPR